MPDRESITKTTTLPPLLCLLRQPFNVGINANPRIAKAAFFIKSLLKLFSLALAKFLTDVILKSSAGSINPGELIFLSL